MLTPASIRVANWREKTWSDFGSTRLRNAGSALGAGLGLRDAARQQAPPAQLLLGGLEIGGEQVSAELEPLGVDGGVAEVGHGL